MECISCRRRRRKNVGCYFGQEFRVFWRLNSNLHRWCGKSLQHLVLAVGNCLSIHNILNLTSNSFSIAAGIDRRYRSRFVCHYPSPLPPVNSYRSAWGKTGLPESSGSSKGSPPSWRADSILCLLRESRRSVSGCPHLIASLPMAWGPAGRGIGCGRGSN